MKGPIWFVQIRPVSSTTASEKLLELLMEVGCFWSADDVIQMRGPQQTTVSQPSLSMKLPSTPAKECIAHGVCKSHVTLYSSLRSSLTSSLTKLWWQANREGTPFQEHDLTLTAFKEQSPSVQNTSELY